MFLSLITCLKERERERENEQGTGMSFNTPAVKHSGSSCVWPQIMTMEKGDAIKQQCELY